MQPLSVVLQLPVVSPHAFVVDLFCSDLWRVFLVVLGFPDGGSDVFLEGLFPFDEGFDSGLEDVDLTVAAFVLIPVAETAAFVDCILNLLLALSMVFSGLSDGLVNLKILVAQFLLFGQSLDILVKGKGHCHDFFLEEERVGESVVVEGGRGGVFGGEDAGLEGGGGVEFEVGEVAGDVEAGGKGLGEEGAVEEKDSEDGCCPG